MVDRITSKHLGKKRKKEGCYPWKKGRYHCNYRGGFVMRLRGRGGKRGGDEALISRLEEKKKKRKRRKLAELGEAKERFSMPESIYMGRG